MPSFKQLNEQKTALAAAKRWPFDTIKPSLLPESAATYYIACTVTDKYGELHEKILYVAQALNLRQHLYVEQFKGTDAAAARLKKRLIADYEQPLIKTFFDAEQYLIAHCYMKYLLVDNSRDRTFLEHGLKFSLSPTYLE